MSSTGHALRKAVARPAKHAHLSKSTKRTIGHVVTVIFLALVAWLIYEKAKDVDWGEVREALTGYPLTILGAALLMATASHVLYACYDLVGRRYAGHQMATHQVLGVGLVSYAFNLNLGALVGGFGFRWRLYSRFGLRQGQIGRIIGLSLVTNWSGYMLLAGLVLAFRTVELPEPVALGTGVLQVLGVVMVIVPIGYIVACATSKRREWHVRGHHFVLPGARMAAIQLSLSTANWALIGAIIWMLLPEGVDYPTALGTMLMAGMAGVITHVPGGLGVIEAVFLATVGGMVASTGSLIAALLAYRAIYYFIPLAGAATMHFTLEAIAKRRRQRQA